MKFKKGDKVKNSNEELDTVKSVPGMKEYDIQDFDSAFKGMILEGYGWEYQKSWELVGKEKPAKPIKFAVVYDRNNVDPIDFYETKPQAIKRIKELAEDSEVSNIRLFEIKREYKVGISKKITFK